MKELKFKIKVYCSFVIVGIAILLGALTLSIGFILTVIPQNY